MPGATPQPPVAARRPHVTTLHGERREDDYAWLRERANPEVIAYLEAENAYTEAMTAHTRPLRETLYAELLSRIQQTDLSVPYRRGTHFYTTRTEEGRQYPIHCRRADRPDAPEEVLLDLNELAAGLAFMAIGDFEVSPDERRLAYTTDSTGYRQYTLHVKSLEGGETATGLAERVTSLAWALDDRTLFYTQEDPVSKRSHRLYRMELDGGAHELLYEERDERFEVGVQATRSLAYVVQMRGSHTTSEALVLDAREPRGEWRLVAPRVQDREVDVDHRGDRFWIRVNDTGRDFRLVSAPVETPGEAHWREALPHRAGVTIEWLACFRDVVVLGEREGALPHLRVLDPASSTSRRVSFTEPAYALGPATNAEFETGTFRYTYQSFLTPPSVFDLDLASLESTLLKRTPVPGGWDPGQYEIERVWAGGADGVQVPVSMVRRRGTPRDGSAPCLLYGYGAYGISANTLFNSNRFSLLDRGMVYAIAHVRGGGDLGRTWHEAGRMRSKRKSFEDFIACAEHLIAARVTSSDRLVIHGGSAGGLLVGAVTNLRPELFHAVFSQVPFVDAITTMLDETLPLTVGEFEEWGNPAIREQYEWMKAYSPYDNLAAREYPAMLVKTGVNDSQVGYWEPAKYVARLRALKTDRNPLLFRVNLGAGHGGASGRYDALHEVAFDYAWILERVGRAELSPTSG